MELCNRGYNSNLKNLLVKHQNNSVYWHRWRLLSGVSLICFYGIILEIFLAELHGWLTVEEWAFARLYPWNHEVAIFLGRRRESEVIYRKNCTCRGCFARSGLNTHPNPTPRGNWVFILYLFLTAGPLVVPIQNTWCPIQNTRATTLTNEHPLLDRNGLGDTLVNF